MSDEDAPLVMSKVDHSRRCVCVKLGERADFQHMVADFRALIRREPVIGTYDYICDLTEFHGDAFVSDVKEISDEYAPHTTRDLTYTCFVTADAAFHLWAKWMDEVFGGRKHLVFASTEECWAFLARERPDS
jgi:hypothetical protein